MNQMKTDISAITTPIKIPSDVSTQKSDNFMYVPVPSPRLLGRNNLVAIIPAYNEEIVIASVVLRAKMYLDNVIVVDDGSRDMTAELARLAGADVIALPINTGKANAIMEGFKRAKEMNYSTIVMLDGDGQHDPRDILKVAEPVMRGEADLVIGSRYLNNDKNTPKYRRIGQKTLDFFTNFASETTTTDSQSGFRALSRAALDNLDFASEGYGIESDMIAHFSERNLRITEVPISVRYEVPHKHKKHPFSHGLEVLGDIFGFIGYKRPIWIFGVPGATIAIIGIIAGFFAYTEYYLTTRFPFTLTMGSALAIVSGLLLITTGLILNSLIQFIRKP
jgi:glycosyltransferase involved in cell wall biosynthesis